jgi:protein involved in sex pheromone biosynthesis
MHLTKILAAAVLISVFSFTTSFTASTNSNAAPWKFIADKNVAFGVDHDVIHLGNLNDDFRQIKLKVTDGPLKIYDMKVYFDNDDVQDISIRKQIRQNGESRVIDLTGGLRHLKKIEFWYETKGFLKGKSRVALWGRK